MVMEADRVAEARTAAAAWAQRLEQHTPSLQVLHAALSCAAAQQTNFYGGHQSLHHQPAPSSKTPAMPLLLQPLSIMPQPSELEAICDGNPRGGEQVVEHALQHLQVRACNGAHLH